LSEFLVFDFIIIKIYSLFQENLWRAKGSWWKSTKPCKKIQHAIILP